MALPVFVYLISSYFGRDIRRRSSSISLPSILEIVRPASSLLTRDLIAFSSLSLSVSLSKIKFLDRSSLVPSFALMRSPRIARGSISTLRPLCYFLWSVADKKGNKTSTRRKVHTEQARNEMLKNDFILVLSPVP